MILYKYVSLEAGLKILESNAIGFTEPRDFNDPFETAARIKNYDFGLKARNKQNELVTLKPVFSNLSNTMNPWANNVAVLSLTRQPRNKLMLAHYSNNHNGMVIGIDISSVKDLTSNEFCYIPAQYGSVIYTETLPCFDLLDNSEKGEFNWESCSYEIRQRALLHKDMAWSMEEEVRIVISLRDYKKNFDVIIVDERPLYLYKLPEGAITEIYFGCRAPILPAMFGKFDTWLKLKDLLEKKHRCVPYQLVLDDNTWDVKSEEINLQVYDGYWELHHGRLNCD